MTDNSTSTSAHAPPKKDERKPGGVTTGNAPRGNTPRKASTATKPAPGSQAPASAGNPSAGGNQPKNPRPNNNARKSPMAPAARLAAGESISRSSSADSHKGDSRAPPKPRQNSIGGGARGGNNQGNTHKKAPSTSRSNTANGTGASRHAPPPTATASAGGENNSNALSSLQRVITDLKSISPPSNPAPVHNQFAQQGNFSALEGNANGKQSSLPANAPVFQPGAAAYPGVANSNNDNNISPRHRKSASAGAGGAPNFNNSTANPNNNAFSSPLAAFSTHLGSMQEDAEDSMAHGEYEDDQPGFSPSQAQPPLHFARQSQPQNNVPPMGSFTAPRFQALAQQRQDNGASDIGPSGRPQLAPNFMFGARRRASMGGVINEDDAGFQFPQQQQQQQQQQFQQQYENPQGPAPQQHRRSGSEIPGVTGLIAEQIALQTQIEALQQQQQQLLQQQIASNQVMASFAAPQMGQRSPAGGHRRIQSQAPMGMGMGSMGGGAFGNFGGMAPGAGANFGLGGLGGIGAPDGGLVPRGHGRRHSVNVINKNVENVQGLGMSPNFGGLSDGFDDGFAAPQAGGHSRQASRADTSWRMNNAGSSQSGGFADLAQAQAQLQSLQQFRAAAGGHHQKMASFSFPNMLPNMMAANMMGMGGYNLLQQQQQQFQLQLQQQSQQPQRKSLFAPYLPQASLPPLLAAGKLVVGILRVNKRNRSDAYISTEVLDADIYICGSKDRNRALEGDIVAVELLDVDEVWGTKKEKEEKKRKKEENAAYDNRAAASRKNDKKKDDVEVEGQGLMLFEDEEVTDDVKPQFAGHVVAVVERMPGQLFSGTLGLLRPSSAATKEKQEAERREREGDRGIDESQKPIERPKIVWFKPTDKRVPLIAIPTEQAPPDFVQNSELYADRLFVACIKRHPISSLHPFGTLVEELGPIGDVEVETSALLKDCNFPTEDFTDNVLKCIPPVPWTIPEREFETRRDLRADRVFTVDPETAKDLDDALSVKVNGDGTYDVSVHIADVSYFVKSNTPLDRDARKRATSVYLVQRAVPMLPPTLSEELCSLVPGEERLAFSATFTMTEDARVIKKWFGRTIIKSSAKLAYSNAQNVIEGRALGDVKVSEGHETSAIEEDVRILHNLAKQMSARRIANGTVRIDSYRLMFDLDENGAPLDCTSYQRKEANSMIEEFMLLTNMSVAQQIAAHLPEQALLRRHEDPIERRLVAFAQRAERMGVKLDTSSAGALQESFNAITNPDVRRLLEILSTKAMHRAKYFCAGMLDIAKYSHYALNTPLYTHFTSPIRRYADVIVHRQLESVLAIGTDPKVAFSMDRDSVAKVAQQCNIKKDSAKLAQEQSAHLFLCLLIADLTQRYGPVIRQAKVVGVLDAAFDVLVPDFGIEKRVHVDQMPIENHVYDEHSHTLQIYWSNRDVITWLAENSDDEHLKKVKQTAEQHALKMEVASRSVHDESALFDEDDETEEDEVVLKRVHTNPPVAPETSKQRLLSAAKHAPDFEGLRTLPAGHHVQDIRELMSVPVIVTADLTKSPPVIKVYSVNPYATGSKK